MIYSSKAQVVASLFLVTMATVDMLTPTYQWTDETGKTIMCQKCPPGTYMAKHCSSESDTICLVCPEEHYTQYWNYLDKCRFCNVLCQEGEQVKHECNSTHNRVCECQPGYHHNGHYCVKDLQCNFQDDTQEEDDEECDNLVIDYFVNLNITAHTFRRLELTIFKHKGRKPISQKRIRNLLKAFKNIDPKHPLLPRLLKSLQEANIHSLERKLRKRFLE
ncbi:tumor necrosis factor receptor superfamily member 6B isoform X1 [Bufo gargarizans]|uniref:tumor necrosis factor receptor superfamily member 6B isoform X1 n=1 Tax=Bufo gargarizans TaxID=30331 RepID=UPI001CF558F0|nr:tumor necrosis factor receptor superfamily member 6B isoform X1 [Bufo gargarizans]